MEFAIVFSSLMYIRVKLLLEEEFRVGFDFGHRELIGWLWFAIGDVM